MPSDVALRFLRLFAGHGASHGRFVVPADARASDKGKLEGKAWTAKKPLTARDVEEHLSGRAVRVGDGDGVIVGPLGVGVCPITDANECSFGGIDVDVYPLDIVALNARARALGFPLVLCRTKSGGAHLYLFLAAPIAAALVRARLVEFASALGYPKAEVFPKQTSITGPSDPNLGNWINLPYQGGERSTRYALGASGASLSISEFLDLAETSRVTADELRAVPLPSVGSDGLLDGAPPCLEQLVVEGGAQGGIGIRNKALFNFAVYLRKRFGGVDRYDEYNARFFAPPVDSREAFQTAHSATKKRYNYLCRQEPLQSRCQRELCVKRKFGVSSRLEAGEDDIDVNLSKLVKLDTDPPTWVIEVNGKKLELTTEELMNQASFQTRSISMINYWPVTLKPARWRTLIASLLDDVEVRAVPNDATRRGQLISHLSRFCTGRVRAKALDEMLLGKPFTEGGRTYFVSTDFFSYLAQHRFYGLSEREVYSALEPTGVDHHSGVIKGKATVYWSVPAFPEQTEAYDVPVAPAQEAM